jgi:hypothetical protein
MFDALEAVPEESVKLPPRKIAPDDDEQQQQ